MMFFWNLVCMGALTIHSCLLMNMLCLEFCLYGQSKSILSCYLSKCGLKLIGRSACQLRVGNKHRTVLVKELLSYDSWHESWFAKRVDRVVTQTYLHAK